MSRKLPFCGWCLPLGKDYCQTLSVQRSVVAMKALALVVVVMFFSMPVDAKLRFGVRGGMNLTQLSLSNNPFDVRSSNGFYIGPAAKLTILGFGIDAAALYDQREVMTEERSNSSVDPSADLSMQQRQICLPVNLRLTLLGIESVASVYVYGGPQWNYNLGDRRIDDFNWVGEKHTKSANIGVGAILVSHIQVNVNYNWAVTKSGSYFPFLAVKDDTSFDAHHSSWQVGLAWWF